MTSILVANLLLFLSSCGDVTAAAAAAARTHQSKGIRPLRRQLQSNNDNELDLPADDSTKTWLFGAGDSSEWGGAAAATTAANDSTVEMNHHRPTLINISALGQGEFVTDTSAGTLHSTVVTNQGRILTASSVAIQTSGIGRDTLDGTQLDFQPIRQVYYLKEDNTHDQNPSTPPTFSKVVASQYYTLALDTAGNVWSTGVNTYGQLCLGDTTARDRFYQVAITIAEEEASTTATKVVDIALGERHTLLLMENGKVFGCGWNAYGQLGIGMKGENMLTPVEILIDEPDFDNNTTDTPPPMVANITQIAAGRGSSYFLTSSNHVYATGTNYEGQLCLGDRVDRPLPTMLVPVEEMLLSQGKNNDFSLHDEGVVVQLIAAGKSSFYMLFTNGQVVACGKNTHGQLGNDNSDSTAAASDVPAVVTALTNVTDIFATSISFTAFFLQNNGIYGVGQDGSGQLGNGAMQWQWDPAVSEVSCPGDEERASIVGQQNIIISSGNDHTLFLVNADAIFDCEGNNNSPLEPTSSMSPFASVAPTPTAPPQMSSTNYPTTPSPQGGTSLFPTLSQPPTMSPVNPDRNQPSGGVKLNGMGVFCSGIAFATWQLLM